MEYKYIGTIVGTRGFKGELRVSDLQTEIINIEPDTIVRIGYSLKFSKEFKLLSWKQTNKSAKLILVGINNEQDGKELIENGIFINSNDIKINRTKSYINDKYISYLAVNYESSEPIGEVIDYLDLPANDLLIIKNNGKEIPIPFVKEFIKKVDNKNKIIKIKLIEGITSLSLK